MPDEISTILDSYHMVTLQEMAIAADIAVTTGDKKLKKVELLVKMRAEFFNQARVQASWQKLSDREKRVLDRLLLRGGKTTATRSLRRELLRTKLVTEAKKEKNKRSYYDYSQVPYAQGYTGDPKNEGSTIFEDVIARLTYYGLVFSRDSGLTSGGTPHKLRFHPAATLYIPEIVRPYLPKPELVAADIADRQPTYIQTAAPVLLLRDLYLYWDFVRRHKVPLIQGGFVGKRPLKAINRTLLVPDSLFQEAKREDETGRLYILRQLLEALNLVHKKNSQLQPLIDSDLHIPEFWTWDPIEQLSACLAAWSQSIKLQNLATNLTRYNTQPLHACQTVLTVLKTLSPTVWFEPHELLERVQRKDPDFFILDHSKVENHGESWYYNYGGNYFSGQTEVLLKTFEKLEFVFVNNCLSGFLHTLGIVELGYDSAPNPATSSLAANGAPSPVPDSDTCSAFRLTTTGQVVLGIGSGIELSSNDKGKLIVQPNFHLMAIGPVSLKILAHLDLFAERKQADQGVFEYQLSRESVYQAQQIGFDAAAVIRFLTETGGVPLPQNVRRSLEEWGTHHERIVFRTGVNLLQAADEALLTSLQAQAAIGNELARSLTSEIALIKKKRGGNLVSALLKQGLLPAIAGGQPEAANHSITIREDGIIQPVHAVPSLHLRGRLAHLAEEVVAGEIAGEIAGGGWRLTPQSVRRAGGNRNKVLRLIDELRQLHRGPLPEKVVLQIQNWGGYYGDVTIETLTLIEFQDQAILHDLAKQPDLQSYLTPFSAGNRALAIIPEEKLTEVQEILVRFGVQVRDGLQR